MDMDINGYLPKALYILKNAKKYLSQEELWAHISTNDKGTILKKMEFPSISPIPCFMIECILNKPLLEAISRIWDVKDEDMQQIDHDIVSWEKLASGNDWKVCHQINTAPWPIWPRELVYAHVKIVESDITWLVAYSIKHPNVPLHDNKYVRAEVIMSIWGFTRLGKTGGDYHKTKVYRIAHIEPRGMIPAWLVTATVSKHVSIVENI